MKSQLHQDLKRLAELAFHRVEACGDLISEFHELPQKSNAHPLYPLMENVRLWLLSPLSLWPVDFVGVGNYILKCIRESKQSDPQLTLLFSFLSKTPTAREQLAIGSHELQVVLPPTDIVLPFHQIVLSPNDIVVSLHQVVLPPTDIVLPSHQIVLP